MQDKFLARCTIALLTGIGSLLSFPVWGTGITEIGNPSLEFSPNHTVSVSQEMAHYDIDELEGVEKKIRDNPNDAEAYRTRGLIRSHSQEDFAGAIEDFSRAIVLDPNNPKNAETYNYRATAYFWLKEYEKSLEDYNQALDIDPNLAIAYYNRGYVYLELKDKGKAITDFEKGASLSKEQGDMDSYNTALELLRELKQ